MERSQAEGLPGCRAEAEEGGTGKTEKLSYGRAQSNLIFYEVNKICRTKESKLSTKPTSIRNAFLCYIFHILLSFKLKQNLCLNKSRQCGYVPSITQAKTEVYVVHLILDLFTELILPFSIHFKNKEFIDIGS